MPCRADVRVRRPSEHPRPPFVVPDAGKPGLGNLPARPSARARVPAAGLEHLRQPGRATGGLAHEAGLVASLAAARPAPYVRLAPRTEPRRDAQPGRRVDRALPPPP